MPSSESPPDLAAALALPPHLLEYVRQQGDGDVALGLRLVVRQALILDIDAEVNFLTLQHSQDELYRMAEQRVRSDPQLWNGRDRLLAKRPDATSDLAWVACAPAEKLADWLETHQPQPVCTVLAG